MDSRGEDQESLDQESPGRTIRINNLTFRLMIDAGRIREGIASIASQISERHAGDDPVLVCVLNGAALFHADLVRHLRFPLQLDYIRISSYDGGTNSSGRVKFTAEPGTLIAGRNVIVVEDVVDTGLTARTLREYFRENGAEAVEIATLLYKRTADRFNQPPEYIAFEIPDQFVVGFGLDYMQYGRNFPEIFILDSQEGIEFRA